MQNIQKVILSEVGFEPTPSSEDQNSRTLLLSASKVYLESGALDRSAILTLLLMLQSDALVKIAFVRIEKVVMQSNMKLILLTLKELNNLLHTLCDILKKFTCWYIRIMSKSLSN